MFKYDLCQIHLAPTSWHITPTSHQFHIISHSYHAFPLHTTLVTPTSRYITHVTSYHCNIARYSHHTISRIHVISHLHHPTSHLCDIHIRSQHLKTYPISQRVLPKVSSRGGSGLLEKRTIFWFSETLSCFFFVVGVQGFRRSPLFHSEILVLISAAECCIKMCHFFQGTIGIVLNWTAG